MNMSMSLGRVLANHNGHELTVHVDEQTAKSGFGSPRQVRLACKSCQKDSIFQVKLQ